MNPIPYFICVALGIAIDATYRRHSEIAERKAYKKGYAQAQKENDIREEEKLKYERMRRYENFISSYNTEPENKPKRRQIPESFMDDLHNNGSAVIKLK